MKNIGIYFLIGICWAVGGFTVCPGPKPRVSADYALHVLLWPLGMAFEATQTKEVCR
jgi:hypothetical protein